MRHWECVKCLSGFLSLKHFTTFCLEFESSLKIFHNWPNILLQNKHGKMCKMFYWKYITSKQMECKAQLKFGFMALIKKHI